MPTRLPPVHWDDLHLVLQLGRTGSARAAAQALGLDASTVRRRLRALEETVQARLFELRAGALTPTPEGQALLRVGQQMDEAASSLQHAGVDRARQLKGVVRVSTMEGFGAAWLAPRLARLALEHPLLSLELVTASAPVNLHDREADISFNMTRPQAAGLRTRSLGEFSVGLYGASSYLDKRGRPTSRRDLEQHDFVGYVRELLAVPEADWLGELMRGSRLRFASTSLHAQMRAVAQGAGLGLLPRFMAMGEAGLEHVLPDEVAIQRRWWLVMREGERQLARIRIVADYLIDALERDRLLLVDPARAAAPGQISACATTTCSPLKVAAGEPYKV